MNAVDLYLITRFPYNGRSGYPQTRIDYDANGNAIYLGVGDKGKASSDPFWKIAKLTYDANNNCTLIQTAPDNQVWDDRASLTYS